MASTASASLSVALDVVQTKALSGFNTAGVQQAIGATLSVDLASTVRVWYETRELAASGTQDYDLAGVLADLFGDTVTYAKLKWVVLGRAANADDSTAGSTVTLAAAPSNGVEPYTTGADADNADGVIVLGCSAGRTVTAGTGDKVRVTNADATNKATYTIAFVGSNP